MRFRWFNGVAFIEFSGSSVVLLNMRSRLVADGRPNGYQSFNFSEFVKKQARFE